MISYGYQIGEFGGSIALAQFWERVRQHELNHWCQAQWPCDLPNLPEVLASDSASASDACEQASCMASLGNDDLAAVQCALSFGYVQVTAAARSKKVARKAIDWAEQYLPRAAREDARHVPITFWYSKRNRVGSLRRTLDVTPWAEIERNYSAMTGQALAGLMDGFTPAKGGQLLLFHGDAGTGKTFALRALASEWRSWCDIDFVIDPDQFLGEAGYLVDVLLAQGRDWDADGSPFGFMSELLGGVPFTGPGENPKKRWRLIVLEDTGELLSADAKERTGQGLRSLLNSVDGLIGQGLRTLILVTTNEPILELHPAVGRAGRCAAAVEFTPLSAAEATAWLGRGIDGPTTIADLFELRGEPRGAPDLPEQAGIERDGALESAE